MIRPIFWFLVDDVVNPYLDLNSSLQKLSHKYPFYAMCSGVSCHKHIRRAYDAKIIVTENDLRVKGRTLFRLLRERNDYDVAVKLDSDSVVMDVGWLLAMIEEHIQPMTVIGLKRRGPVTGGWYIRGGCQASHHTVIERTELDISETRAKDFDFCFTEAAIRSGVKFINVPLFEIGQTYSGNSPVWHPDKDSGRRLQQVRAVIRYLESL